MQNFKKNLILTSMISTLMLVGCGGGSSSSSNNSNNDNASNPTNNNGGTNTNNNGNSNAQIDLALDNQLQLFRVAEVIPTQDIPTDFAILYEGETKIAYQTKGFKWSDYQASAPAETEMVLTKTKLYENVVSEEIIAHKPGQYTYGSKDDGGYRAVFDYKIANIEGKKILDNSFFTHSGLLDEQTFYSNLDAIYEKIERLIGIAKPQVDKFPKDSYCGTITHVEFKQPTIEFNVDEFSEAYETAAEWIEDKKDEKFDVTTDNYAGYKVVYAIDPNGINESEAIVEYKGTIYYASYNPQQKIDIEQQFIKSINKLKSVIGVEKDKDVAEGLKEALKLRENQYAQFKNNTLCDMYNGTAAKSILSALNKLDRL